MDKPAPTPTNHPWSCDPTLVLIDQKRLAKMCLCSERTIERKRLDGTGIPFVRIGRLVRYRLSDVLEYLQAQRRTSTSDEPRGDHQ